MAVLIHIPLKLSTLMLQMSVLLIWLYQPKLMANTCSAFVGQQEGRSVVDKLITEIEKLNPEILSEKRSVEQIFIDLKNEEARWHKNGYFDFKKTISADQKQRITDHFKVNIDQLKSEHDFALFYVNQLRFFYIRNANFIYDQILKDAAPGLSLSGNYKKYARSVVDSFFAYDLRSQSLTVAGFTKIMEQAPWKNFDWIWAIEAFKKWEAQEDQGVRSQMNFVHELKEQNRDVKIEDVERIASAIRFLDREKLICCRSGMGCQNCPLNRRYLQ